MTTQAAQTAANLPPVIQPNAAAVSNPPANFTPAQVPLNPANSGSRQSKQSVISSNQTTQTQASLSPINPVNVANVSNPPANFASEQVPLNPTGAKVNASEQANTVVPTNLATGMDAAQTGQSSAPASSKLQANTQTVSNPAIPANSSQRQLHPTTQQGSLDAPNAPATFTSQSQVPPQASVPKPISQKAPLPSGNIAQSQFSNTLAAAPDSEGNSSRLTASSTSSQTETFSENAKPSSEEHGAASNPVDDKVSSE